MTKLIKILLKKFKKIHEYIETKQFKKKRDSKKVLKLFDKRLNAKHVTMKLEIKVEYHRLIAEIHRKYKRGEQINIDKIRINRKNFPSLEEFLSQS